MLQINMYPPLTPNKNVTFYPFLQGAALHLKGTHQICVLNTTAATTWCLLDSDRDKHELAQHYAERFNLKQLNALIDVETILSEFWEMGLLQDAKIPQIAVTSAKPASVRNKKIPRPPAADLSCSSFEVSDQYFTLRSNNETIIRQWSRLINPLTKTSDQNTDDRSKRVDLQVLADPAGPKGRFALWKNNRLAINRMVPDSVVPHIVYQIFNHVCAAQYDRLLIHAAVLSRNGHALVLPGQAGAGKSTLTAALGASGWTYLSDELALIDPNTLQVAPYPMPIGLKNKSVKPLADFIPGLTREPVHTRADGRQVRYFMPTDSQIDGSLPIAALVFPNYQPSAKNDNPNTLEPREPTPNPRPLPPLEALQQLAATGSSDRPLRHQDIKALLSLAQLPAYELGYFNLKQALNDIEKEMGNR